MATKSKTSDAIGNAGTDGDSIIVRAASVVVLRGSEVLLVKRGRPPAKNLWSFPGGKIKPGETPAQTAIREALEETGLEVTLLGPIGTNTAVIPATNQTQERQFELDVFTGTVGPGAPYAGDDAEEARFIRIEDVVNYATTDGALSWIKKAQLRHDSLKK